MPATPSIVGRYTCTLNTLILAWLLPTRRIYGQLIDGPASDTTSGEERTLEYIAPWPPWVSILVLLGCGFLVVWLYLRESDEIKRWTKLGLGGIRLALIALVLWMMYGATERPFRTDLPDLLLIVDDSKSMATVDAMDEKLRASVAEDVTSLPTLLTATENVAKVADNPDSIGFSRLAQAQAVLLREDAGLLHFLTQNYQVKLSGLHSAREPQQTATDQDLAQQIAALQASDEASPLGDVLRSALRQQRGRPVAAIIFMTDGVTTEGALLSEASLEAGKRNVPLHIVGLGSRTPAKDVKLSDLMVDDVVFVGDVVNFDVSVSGAGYESESIQVDLRRSGETEILSRQQVRLAPELGSELEPSQTGEDIPTSERVQTARVTWQADEPGEFEFEVVAASQPGEATLENNRLTARIEVRDEKTRVLYIQAYANFEYHYLRTLLQRAAEGPHNDTAEQGSSLEVAVLLQEADPNFPDIDPLMLRTFPTREELFEYDVCIFGDVNPSFLSKASLQDLRDFVMERGRGFVGIAGPKYFPMSYADTPLAELLPFELSGLFSPPVDLPIETGFRAELTELGKQMPAMQLTTDPSQNLSQWKALSELFWRLEVNANKMGVRTLLAHPHRDRSDESPIVTLSFAGAGKVLFHYTDESWRWRIGYGDEFFGRYWMQTIRYLSRYKLGEGRDIELSSDREIYRMGEPVRLRARFFDDRLAPSDERGVILTVEPSGSRRQQVTLSRDPAQRGVFSGTVRGLAAGKYHTWMFQPTFDPAPSLDFVVETPDTELTRLQADIPEMRRAAENSKGRFYTYASASELREHLPVGRQVRIEALTPEPLWNAWPVAVLFVVLLITEWLLRRRFGMA